jgi:hypothetical protein
VCDASSLFLNAEKGVSFFYRFGCLVFAIIAVIGSIGRVWIFFGFSRYHQLLDNNRILDSWFLPSSLFKA